MKNLYLLAAVILLAMLTSCSALKDLDNAAAPLNTYKCEVYDGNEILGTFNNSQFASDFETETKAIATCRKISPTFKRDIKNSYGTKIDSKPFKYNHRDVRPIIKTIYYSFYKEKHKEIE